MKFNETDANTASKFLLRSLRKMIVDNHTRTSTETLEDLKTTIYYVVRCYDGLEGMLSEDAVIYLFSEVLKVANKNNVGCSKDYLADWLEKNPIVIKTAYEAIQHNEEIINKSKELERKKQYGASSFNSIMQKIKAKIVIV